ncbi:transcriptional regulator [Bifidobacterium cuniculi]|uniref:Transcriptional regulator n=2 Tax=Bifidobacterium cuniculi TaxID=1688 RepID=A0A087B495_9BIFI|nr:transcriptional regulator [Bifidobacterium cuniculi]
MQRVAAGNDAFGYDRHARNQALRMANGVAVIILGFSLGSFLALLPERSNTDLQEVVHGLDRLIGLMTKDLVELPAVQHHPETFIVEVLGVLVGYVILKHMRQDADDYRSAFRRIEPFYTAGQRRRSKLAWAAFDIIGIAMAVLVPFLMSLLPAGVPDALVAGVNRLALAGGVWCIVYGTMLGMRTDLFRYNFHALRQENVYELGLRESDSLRETRLGEKRLCDLSDSITHVGIMIGVIGALALYFLPTMRTAYFWVPIVVTVVVTMLLQWAVMSYAKRTYEPDFDADGAVAGALA